MSITPNSDTVETPEVEKVIDPDCHPLFREVPSSVGFKKLRKRLLRENASGAGRVQNGACWGHTGEDQMDGVPVWR